MAPTFEGYNTSLQIWEYGSTAVSGFDIGFAIVFFGIGFLSIWGTSSLLATSKVLIPIFLFLLFFTIILSVAFANVFEDFIFSDEGITATAENYPIIVFIFSKFPFFVGFIGLMIMVSTYGKTKGQQSFGV